MAATRAGNAEESDSRSARQRLSGKRVRLARRGSVRDRETGSPKKTTLRDVRPEHVRFKSDRLRLVLRDYDQRFREQDRWEAPLGLAAGLWATVLVSDFTSSKMGLSGSQWQVIFVGGAIFSTLWFCYALMGSRRARVGHNELFEALMAEAEMPDVTSVLFYLSGLDSRKQTRILVQWDPIWDCFLLPFIDLDSIGAVEGSYGDELEEFARYLFDVNDALVIPVKLASLRTRKPTVRGGPEQEYAFEFVHVKLPEPPESYLHENIVNAPHRFQWITLDDLLRDRKTLERNADVLTHIRNKLPLFYQLGFSFSEAIQCEEEPPHDR